jgi:hypothetical protein
MCRNTEEERIEIIAREVVLVVVVRESVCNDRSSCQSLLLIVSEARA